MNQQAKFNMITDKTLVVGIDIAKHTHWAQCINYRGELIAKAFPFQNNKSGFLSLLQRIKSICQKEGFDNIVVGVEPTGHYWKCLAYALAQEKIPLVLVNTAHVKKSSELDDNSPSKTDRKDAGVIARLIKDARFSVPNLPVGIYSDLKNLVNERDRIIKKTIRTRSQIHNILDSYFPEFFTVLKEIDSKTAKATLRNFPLPGDILQRTDQEILECWGKVNPYRKHEAKVQKLKEAARQSIGLSQGVNSIKLEIKLLMEEWDFHQKQLEQIEREIKNILQQISYSKELLAIKGIGTISLATILAETGDLRNYQNWKQLRKLAGLNLVEHSSGAKKGRSHISKKGRRKLRSILYLVTIVMVIRNPEFRQIYHALKERTKNPLTGKQALIALVSKLLRIIHVIANKNIQYDPEKVLPKGFNTVLAA